MSQRFGVLNLMQAVVYVGFGLYLMSLWLPAAVMMWLAAAAQVGGGLSLLMRNDAGPLKAVNVLSLLAVGIVVGLHLQVAVHIVRTFTPAGALLGWGTMGIVAATLPWAVFLPVGQLVAQGLSVRASGGVTGALALALVLPPAWASIDAAQAYPAQDGAAGARWLLDAAKDASTPPPEGDGPTILMATWLARGQAVTHSAEAADFPSALRQLREHQPSGAVAAVALEVVRGESPIRRFPLEANTTQLLNPGDGLRDATGPHGAIALWRPEKVASVPVLPFIPVTQVLPSAHVATSALALDGWLATEQTVTPLHVGWTPGQPLTADSAREAALNGGRHLVHNLQEDGRFTYVVQGITGRRLGGYNYPRHCGATWFLARLYSRTQDASIREGALRAVAHAKSVTRFTSDGRAYVHDPGRKDGKAWVGTTALALLGLVELDVEPALQLAYGNFIASSVDEDGRIRGNFSIAEEEFPAQDEVTYAQGQGLLALASAHGAGLPVKPALERAARYADEDYWPQPAARLVNLDDHWMCLASVATQRVLGWAAGKEVCTSYLLGIVRRAPTPGATMQPAAGPAGGLAEAVIARAELDRLEGHEGAFRNRALDYATLLLNNQYQPTDAAFLHDSEALVGGFRDLPWSLDVRVDAVQHIGCALMGAEQLLRDEVLPGAMP